MGIQSGSWVNAFVFLVTEGKLIWLTYAPF